MRDIVLADTIYMAFTTRAFATGIPTTLAGTPVVSAYEDAGLTQITAGITLGVDHDGVTGLHMLTIVATGANGFADNQDYNLVITTGTVGGVSVVGEVVGQFSIQRSPVNWANVSNPTTALDLSGTDIQLVDTVTTYTGNTVQTGDNFARIGAAGAGLTNINLPNQTMDITGNLSGSVGSVTGAVGSVTGHTNQTGDTYALANGAAGFVAIDTVVDAILVDTAAGGAGPWTTGAGTGLTPLASGTAQSGTASTVVLASASTFANDELNGNTIKITSGTGAGQARVITDYVGATDTATVTPNWTTNPSSDSVYEVVDGSINVTAWLGAAASALETAADVWTSGTRTLTVADWNVGKTGYSLTVAPLTAAEVNAEMVDVLATDTYAEPGQGTPGATISLSAKIGYLYKGWRNRSDQTATLYQLYSDDATTVDQRATVSDDTTTATKNEIVTGP